jgi:hypothetical protein
VRAFIGQPAAWASPELEKEIDEEALNYTGDRLMSVDKRAGITLFELNVHDHPRSSRVHEFLAEN